MSSYVAVVCSQELTPAGVHVRTIGEGVIPSFVSSVAASGDVIAVGCDSDTALVFLLHASSGDFIRSFGAKGRSEGELWDVTSIRFTPDGGHLLIAEFDNNRLSLLRINGEFARCIGVGTLMYPQDAAFARNGDILVVDRGHSRVCVYSSDGSTTLHCFGAWGSGEGQFRFPTSLAVHSDTLYVLEGDSARVQVFS